MRSQNCFGYRFSPFTLLRLALPFILVVVLCMPVSAQIHNEKTLTEYGITIDTSSFSTYLKSIPPTPENKAAATALVEKLGDQDYSNREAVIPQLLKLYHLPTDALNEAATKGDPEVKFRAQYVLERHKLNCSACTVIRSMLHVIAERKIPGLTADLLAANTYFQEQYLVKATESALKATVSPKDSEIIRNALRSEHLQVRIAAISVLRNATGEDAHGVLLQLLNDPEDRVKLAAAFALVEFDDRKCLEPLVKLLDSDNLQVRGLAVNGLRQITGQHYGFAAPAPAEKRASKSALWKGWFDREGNTSKLKFSITTVTPGRGDLKGNTLMALGLNHKVVEYDSLGKVVWAYSGRARSAEKMLNGNVLVSEGETGRVLQISPQGKIVWQYKSTGHLFNAKPLASGNILVAKSDKDKGSQAIEVDPDGKIVWKYDVDNCRDVHRLENGNTLIAISRYSAREITPDGEIVWEYKTPGICSCQPLPGGQVLIADLSGDRVFEVTRDKKIVWEYRPSRASDIFRVPNGNTLITEADRCIEVTPDKKIVWSRTDCHYGSARQ